MMERNGTNHVPATPTRDLPVPPEILSSILALLNQKSRSSRRFAHSPFSTDVSNQEWDAFVRLVTVCKRWSPLIEELICSPMVIVQKAHPKTLLDRMQGCLDHLRRRSTSDNDDNEEFGLISHVRSLHFGGGPAGAGVCRLIWKTSNSILSLCSRLEKAHLELPVFIDGLPGIPTLPHLKELTIRIDLPSILSLPDDLLANVDEIAPGLSRFASLRKLDLGHFTIKKFDSDASVVPSSFSVTSELALTTLDLGGGHACTSLNSDFDTAMKLFSSSAPTLRRLTLRSDIFRGDPKSTVRFIQMFGENLEILNLNQYFGPISGLPKLRALSIEESRPDHRVDLREIFTSLSAIEKLKVLSIKSALIDSGLSSFPKLRLIALDLVDFKASDNVRRKGSFLDAGHSLFDGSRSTIQFLQLHDSSGDSLTQSITRALLPELTAASTTNILPNCSMRMLAKARSSPSSFSKDVFFLGFGYWDAIPKSVCTRFLGALTTKMKDGALPFPNLKYFHLDPQFRKVDDEKIERACEKRGIERVGGEDGEAKWMGLANRFLASFDGSD